MAGEIQIGGTTFATESGGTVTIANVDSATNRTNLGLGSIATQASDSIDINGGTIDGTTIGGTSAAVGTFTTFTSTGIDDNASSNALTIDSNGNLGLTNSSNIARIKAENSVSLADDGSINVTTLCGASIVCAYDQYNGEGIACFVTYSTTATVVGQSSNTANSDTDNKLCIFKSAGSHTTTVKNRLGSTKNFSISVIGSTSD